MTIANTAPSSRSESSSSVFSALRSPNLFVREALAGIVTALALIPEVISFSFISGVDAKVALLASIVLCLVMSVLGDDGREVCYDIHGPLFFGSSNGLVERFSYGTDPAAVTIDLTHSQIWDASSVATLDSIENKYRAHGAKISFTGLDARSSAFHGRLTGRL
jgi:sulfate permease, SulP family